MFSCVHILQETHTRSANHVNTWGQIAKSVRFFQVCVTRARNVRFCQNDYLHHNFTAIFVYLPALFVASCQENAGTGILHLVIKFFLARNIIFMNSFAIKAIFRVTNSIADFSLRVTWWLCHLQYNFQFECRFVNGSFCIINTWFSGKSDSVTISNYDLVNQD